MDREKMMQMLEAVEEKYIAEAVDLRPEKRRSYWRTAAACAALFCVIGISAYAEGLFDPLLEYISGDPMPDQVQMAAMGQTVTDGQVTLRLESALCDDHVGQAIVSFLGLPEEAQDLDIQEQFAFYGVTADGEKTGIRSWESGTYTAHSSKAEAVTLYPDADMTFVLTWQPADGMDGIEQLTFAYGDLVLAWETAPVRLPEYRLIAAEGRTAEAVLSGLGLYAVTEEEYFGGRILLHYPDGSTVEPSYSASLDIDRYAALWGGPVGIGYYDPAELSWISIDGVRYDFAE